MSTGTGIEWTQSTWNPLAGCTPVSPGCLRCYAATMAHRLEAMGQEKYRGLTVLRNGIRTFNGKINLDPDSLTIPLHRKKPTMYFVNSMSDLFHEAVPFHFIDRVFAVMALCPQHTFQVLTKRPERMAEYLNDRRDSLGFKTDEAVFALAESMADDCGWCHPGNGLDHWPLLNVWLGTSVENLAALSRIDALADCPAATYFVSFEPLLEDLGDISAKLRMLIWAAGNRPERVLAIIGGESGPRARPCDVAWIRSVVQQCKAANVPVFVKQLGANPIEIDEERASHVNMDGDPADIAAWMKSCEKSLDLNDPKGGNPDEWPSDIRVREMPEVTK